MAEPPDDWSPRRDKLPPQGSLQEAVEAFLRSPLPASTPPGEPAERLLTKPHAVAIDDGPDPPGDESLAITIAEGLAPGCHVRFFGRWANVQLEPPGNDDWRNGRMFVIDRYALIDELPNT